MENFYDRTQRLLGAEAMERLRALHVMIIGVGGVGSWAAETLARCGVGTLTLVDDDRVEATNLNRQVHALMSTIGQYKVDAMAARLLDINPDLVLHTHRDRIVPDALPAYLGDCDFTIDCIDDVQAKVALIAHLVGRGKKVVSSMGTGNKLCKEPFKIADISKTKVCPLARAVRKRLREVGVRSGVAVLYSEEPAYRVCGPQEKPGTIVFAPAMAGCELARYVVMETLDV